jgi:hypothetical protein
MVTKICDKAQYEGTSEVHTQLHALILEDTRITKILIFINKVFFFMLEHHFVGFLPFFHAHLQMTMCTYHGKHLARQRVIKSIIWHTRIIIKNLP